MTRSCFYFQHAKRKPSHIRSVNEAGPNLSPVPCITSVCPSIYPEARNTAYTNQPKQIKKGEGLIGSVRLAYDPDAIPSTAELSIGKPKSYTKSYFIILKQSFHRGTVTVDHQLWNSVAIVVSYLCRFGLCVNYIVHYDRGNNNIVYTVGCRKFNVAGDPFALAITI